MNLSTTMWTTAVVGAVAVYWFVWVMGSAEVKGKRALNLKMGSIMRDKGSTPGDSFLFRRPLQPFLSPAYLPFLMQDKAAAEDGEKETFSKKPRHCEAEMPFTDSEEDSFLFPVKEIVQYPLPGYVAPSSISFSPDGRLISYLFSPDGTLHRKVFAFEVASRWQELVIWPPDGGGLDESNLSAEEKLRRERSRERGLGVTRYEWKSRSTSSSCSTPGKPTIMVPLPNGLGCLIIKCSRSLEPVGILMYTTVPPQVVWGVSEQQHNKKVEATIKEYNQILLKTLCNKSLLLVYLIPNGDCDNENEEDEHWPCNLRHENDDA
ncbi:hypothetical protein ZIOFF_056987 [Zingiber officinale]|uniref:Uncharacterized protein n=1 Tax=Zingiber officinale TaxID=94328 RepID=A0A8J5FMZ4_ZINOF|nr:hypothetical protein ZIOFF_056987 [Zingiber officinale]